MAKMGKKFLGLSIFYWVLIVLVVLFFFFGMGRVSEGFSFSMNKPTNSSKLLKNMNIPTKTEDSFKQCWNKMMSGSGCKWSETNNACYCPQNPQKKTKSSQ